MEELRSTEILDKEIKSEAKKKAEAILARADQSANELLSSVNSRLEEAEKKARADGKKRSDLFAKNIGAALPLEKERLLVSYIHGSLVSAMNSYFAEMSDEKKLKALEKLFAESSLLLKKFSWNVKVYGFNLDLAKSFLEKVLPSSLLECSAGKDYEIEDEAVSGFEYRAGFVLTSSDSSVQCRFTLDEIVKKILDEKRMEVATSLFKGGLPE